MGIPKYFRWVVKRYPDLLISEYDSTSASRTIIIDNLYFDANCLIHPCVRTVLEKFSSSLLQEHNRDYAMNKHNILENAGVYSKLEKKMFEEIVQYIVYLCTFVKPSKLLYVAIDGIAPRAKMKQQRSRRYRSQKEKQLIRAIYAKHGKHYQEQWDTNAITPGTTFMIKLSHYLQLQLPKKLQKFGCSIILSDTSRPGEGEHKIMEHIRAQEVALQTSVPAEVEVSGEDHSVHQASVPSSVLPVHCIYGLDADLIMLSLCSTHPIFLLRESVHYGGKVDSDELLLFDISQFKVNMFKEIRDQNEYLEFAEMHRVIMDYVFLCFLLGNDFLPHITHLEIAHDSINVLLEIYVKLLGIKKTYLVDGTSIDFGFLKQVLNQVFNMEDSILSKIQKRYDYRRPRRLPSYRDALEEDVDLLKFFPLQHKNHAVCLGRHDWRDEYYYYYFHVKNTQTSRRFIEKVCHKYVEGLQWNLNYYVEGCSSWRWVYPFRAAPCLRDLCHFLNTRIYKIEFPLDAPYTPLEQLLLVLPRSSHHLLPREYDSLLSPSRLDIAQYYPSDFRLDTLHKVFFHECEPILPIIQVSVLDFFKNIQLSPMGLCKNTVTSEDKILTLSSKKRRQRHGNAKSASEVVAKRAR